MSSSGKSSEKKAAPASGHDTKVSSREAAALLGIVCFFSSASMLVIEIAGNRLLAPVFGNSLYTWTALIGVVLVAFSVGGYLGGWLVDRSPSTRVLGMLLVAAALTTLLIPPLSNLLQGSMLHMDLVAGPVLLSLVLFMIPGCILGAITPFTIRLLSMVTNDTRIGSAAGVVGMLGNLGAFTGTFASGFILIPAFGVRQIFLFTAITLLLLGVMVFVRFRSGLKRSDFTIMLGFLSLGVTLFVVVAPAIAENTVWRKLTFYHLIQVYDEPYGSEGRDLTARRLRLDTTNEGGQVIETGEIFGYQRYWQLAQALGSDMKRALFLGAGAFGMPQHVARHWPEAEVEVVEIDPQVIQAGYDCFRLAEYENVIPVAMDARRYLATSDRKYDLIFGDAYNGERYIPAHLTTREFFETVRAGLSDRGIFMMNIISGLSGDRAELFQSIYATVASVFENVEVFSVSPHNYVVPHNIILIASDRELDNFFRRLPEGTSEDVFPLVNTRVDPTVYADAKGVVLTDDRNPVEWIVARQLRKG